MSFGENLQTIRRKNRLSQEDLAELLGVSRQAVSKWENGEGYPEVDKLLVLSEKLDISLDSLMGTGNRPAVSGEGSAPGTIRIVSPNEGVIINASRVTRSQQYRGGKNSPKYALFAFEGSGTSAWGPQAAFLAWYRDLEDVNEEIGEINKALDEGRASYTLQYSVKCRQDLMRTIEE